MGTSKYNLEQLGWFNFEQLIRTLLREIIGNGISTFSGSVDQGRDATFKGKANSFPGDTDQWDGSWIFQVKHRTYSTRGASTVRTELKRTLPAEMSAIHHKYKHTCDYYVAITNCPLTTTDKDEIEELLKSSAEKPIKCATLGEADLQELLDGHPRVVSAFPQIVGLSQLRELVAWGLHQRSIQYLQTAQSDIATFVATTPYLKAIDLLHKQHFCILSGPPKMGKTCTAYAVAASFAALSYEIYDLRNQKDFYDAYRPDSKQLFICDDVFGDISLNASQRDDWARSFLRLLGSLDRDHKLVWTAREYILKEALSSSRLKEERPELVQTDTVTVAVDHLSRIEKAMILYNHSRVADFPTEVCEYLRSKACIAIIDHSNYSPETIRQLCTSRLVSFSEAAGGDNTMVAKQVQAFLSAPGDAWKSAYLAAPAGEQLLCTEVMAAGGSIPVAQLQKRYESTALELFESSQPFEENLTNAQGTFLIRKSSYWGDTVQFYHPSMRDLLGELIQTDKSIRTAYLKQLVLKELPAIIRPLNNKLGGESKDHRLLITEKDDIDLLQNHLKNNLLPSATLSDARSVVVDLKSSLAEGKKDLHPSALRKSSMYGTIFWMVLDNVVPFVCSKQFWQNNCDKIHAYYWERLLNTLRTLLPYAVDAVIPLYIPDLLQKAEDRTLVDYWQLVITASKIVPTIVEQCVDLRDREECREYMVLQIGYALDSAEEYDLEGDYDASQQWHDDYQSVYDECEEYVMLFPDDESMSGMDKLKQIIDNYPRLEDYSDEEREMPAVKSDSSSSDKDILEMFSDL